MTAPNVGIAKTWGSGVKYSVWSISEAKNNCWRHGMHCWACCSVLRIWTHQQSTSILSEIYIEEKAETPISPPTDASKIYKAMQQQHIAFLFVGWVILKKMQHFLSQKSSCKSSNIRYWCYESVNWRMCGYFLLRNAEVTARKHHSRHPAGLDCVSPARRQINLFLSVFRQRDDYVPLSWSQLHW